MQAPNASPIASDVDVDVDVDDQQFDRDEHAIAERIRTSGNA
ncbi:hypothetical protein [Aquimonas sp.]|jgi:hypothetical protein